MWRQPEEPSQPACLTKRMIECTLTDMTPAPAPRERLRPRLLSTAEERREEVLRAAMNVMGARGLYGTPTLDIAHAAGISQAYLFRLFPTKLSLFLAVVERSFQQIHDSLERAGRATPARGEPALMAMAAAYNALLEDPGILLVQLQAQAAASEPEVRDSLRRGLPTCWTWWSGYRALPRSEYSSSSPAGCSAT
jgi:AcrR family transcriptional regulator